LGTGEADLSKWLGRKGIGSSILMEHPIQRHALADDVLGFNLHSYLLEKTQVRKWNMLVFKAATLRSLVSFSPWPRNHLMISCLEKW